MFKGAWGRCCLLYTSNSACKEAIEQTISAHYAENRLDTEAAVKDVLEKFGTERVQFILANTIQRKNHDGRISQNNKAWAKTIPMPEDSDASRHCAYLVVDGVNPFIRRRQSFACNLRPGNYPDYGAGFLL